MFSSGSDLERLWVPYWYVGVSIKRNSVEDSETPNFSKKLDFGQRLSSDDFVFFFVCVIISFANNNEQN